MEQLWAMRGNDVAKVLVAASPEPRAVVQRMLAGHELACATDLTQAVQLLGERRFDLILCTIAFDDSKMFELLRLAKSKAMWRQIPFVGARVREQVLRSPAGIRAAAFTCRELGAEAFLDIADYREEPEREMREAIERILKPAEQK